MSGARVLYNRPVTPQHRLMGLEWEAPAVRPGQFVMLKPSNALDPFLRRPFGIYDAVEGGVEILYKVVGKGTSVMAALRPGHDVDVIGPLGNGFPHPPGQGKIIAVAGGIGIAALNLFVKKYAGATLLFGARDRVEARLSSGIRKSHRRTRLIIENDGQGRKGLVTDLLEQELTGDSVVYACGPLGMLKAVASMALLDGVECHVSLERAMACGVGACLGCAVKTGHAKAKEGAYRMVCSDGPVFRAEDIMWELL